MRTRSNQQAPAAGSSDKAVSRPTASRAANARTIRLPRGATRTPAITVVRTPAREMISATPLRALLTTLNERITLLEVHAPYSDAVAALRACARDLYQALERAEHTDDVISSADAAVALGIGEAAVTARCRKGTLIAERNGNRWMIDAACVYGNRPRASAQ